MENQADIVKKKKTGSTESHESIANSFDLSAEVSHRVEIKSVRLVSTKCAQAPNAPGAKLNLSMDVSAHTEVTKDKKALLVFPEFTVTGKVSESDEEPAITIQATFLLIYKIDDIAGLNNTHFDQFGKINGLYNAWPYWREYVQNTTSRMGLEPILLPVYRIQAKPNNRKGKAGHHSNAVEHKGVK